MLYREYHDYTGLNDAIIWTNVCVPEYSEARTTRNKWLVRYKLCCHWTCVKFFDHLSGRQNYQLIIDDLGICGLSIWPIPHQCRWHGSQSRPHRKFIISRPTGFITTDSFNTAKNIFVFRYIKKKTKEPSWCQFSRYSQYQRLSFWPPLVPPVTPVSAPLSFSV